MVGVEHPPGLADVDLLVAAHGPRQIEDAVEPGADPALLGRSARSCARAAPARGAPRCARVSGSAVAELVELGPVVVGAGVLLAELLADRGHLLAEQVLALLLLHPLGDVVADLGADVQLAEEVLGPRDDELQPGAELGQLEHGEAMIGAGIGPSGDRRRPARRDATWCAGSPAAAASAGPRRCPRPGPAARGRGPRRGASGRDSASGSMFIQRPAALARRPRRPASARWTVRTMMTRAPLGSSADLLDGADDADGGGAALDLGQQQDAMLTAVALLHRRGHRGAGLR